MWAPPQLQTLPVLAIHKDNGKRSDFLALDERGGLEELVESTETARHDDERARVGFSSTQLRDAWAQESVTNSTLGR